VDLEAELALLTADGLTPMVRELLQDPDARARTWEVERVGWVAVNPGTLGIHRVHGVADTGGGQRPFTLVFKAVADVDLPGFPDSGDSGYMFIQGWIATLTDLGTAAPASPMTCVC
jgi:hypothetical protein